MPAFGDIAVGPSVTGLRKDLTDWLESFRTEHGRPLRVLHVGNIANNAYINAKMLNAAGCDCDVLCYDYYHVMGTPEWEEAVFDTERCDLNNPDWSALGVGESVRPRWFAQGPLALCVQYLNARRRGHPSAEQYWREIAGHNRTAAADSARPSVKYTFSFARSILSEFGPITIADRMANVLASLVRRCTGKARAGAWGSVVTLRHLPPKHRAYIIVLLPLAALIWLILRRPKARKCPSPKGLARRFAEYFPGRKPGLKAEECHPHMVRAAMMRQLFTHYDLIQCYGLDPMYGVMTGHQPYVAFEHGTLRDFTQGDDPLHRLVALGYRAAQHTFVTNGDCLEHARRLGLDFSPIIHPIDVEQHRAIHGPGREHLRREMGADVLLFCPVRHDWDVKGTDIFLRALPEIKERLAGRKVVMLLANWGAHVEDSRQLLESLGCTEDVRWLPPLPRISMIQWVQAADVVMDQAILPCFGSTAPQSLAAGTPVISSYRPESTEWIIPDPAPILSAFNPAEVAAAVMQAVDPEWRTTFARDARTWIDTWHSPRNFLDVHLDRYRLLLERKES